MSRSAGAPSRTLQRLKTPLPARPVARPPSSYRSNARSVSSSSSSYSSASSSRGDSQRIYASLATAVAGGSLLYYAFSSPIQNDARPAKVDSSPTSSLHAGHEHLGVHLWGSNRYGIVAPDAGAPSTSTLISGQPQAVKKPRYLVPLSGQSFRDLALHESYAVAVTPKGDLVQWGHGYSKDATSPQTTLKGQNVVQLALTSNKIYARTRSGKVLIVPASKDDQTDTTGGKTLPSTSILWKMLGYSDPGVHFIEMGSVDKARSAKKIVDISAGRSHLLALAEDGKALAAAVDSDANDMGQLGGQRLLDAISSKQGDGDKEIIQERDIRYDTALKEIPALRSLKIRQLAAGDRHSLALTTEGRVLGWGNNSSGQLALGNSYLFPTIPAPTESALSAAYPKGTRISCDALWAGGDVSYFLVSRKDRRSADDDEMALTADEGQGKASYQDLLAAGNGMYGGIGNGQWNSSGTAARVKTVSGLREYNESTKRIQSIPIQSVSVNATHTAVVLDNAVEDKVTGQAFGNDVYVFGHNADYQLGTGKRSNLAIPQHIPPLPYPLTEEVKQKLQEKSRAFGKKEEESLDSGTKSHMPHNRLQLAPRKKKLEERIVCGYGVTAVYWHTNA